MLSKATGPLTSRESLNYQISKSLGNCTPNGKKHQIEFRLTAELVLLMT